MIHNACCCGGKAKELTVTIAPGYGGNSFVRVDNIKYQWNSDTNNIVVSVNRGSEVYVQSVTSTNTGNARIYLNGDLVANRVTHASYKYTVTDYSVNIQVNYGYIYIVELK